MCNIIDMEQYRTHKLMNKRPMLVKSEHYTQLTTHEQAVLDEHKDLHDLIGYLTKTYG